MRLLLVTAVYPTPRRPTKGTFNRELVTALRHAGDDVRVIAPVPWTDLFVAPTGTPEPGVTYPAWFYPPRIGHAHQHRWLRRAVLPAAARLAAEARPDLVLGYWTHPDGTVALEVARRLGVPGVLLVGGSDIRLLTANPARRRVIVATLAAAARVLAIGEPLRQRVIALGIDPAAVVAVARGVDTERFHPGPPAEARRRLGLPGDRHIALWVGRMEPVKGLDVLLDAWGRLAATAPRPLLVLVGDGGERAALERRARAFGDSVRFVGPMPHDALPDWYRAADCVVLPSRSEGMPNVLLESLACGTPFVASDVGSVAELLEPSSAVVPAGDAAALAAALDRQFAAAPLERRSAAPVTSRADAVALIRAQLAGVVAAAPPAGSPVAA